MSKSIPQIPEIPVEIKDARNKDKLAIFIGAGVSRLLGCKDWHSLALDLLEQCYNNEYINYREYDQLSKYTDNKKIISIAYGLLKDKDEKLFFQTMKKSLSQNNNDCEIYDYIYKIGSLFVTTNADEIFDKLFVNPYDKEYIFTRRTIKPEKNKLYHIHGNISNTRSLVFTASQYLDRYKDEHFVSFLKTLFTEYTVLFVGYGLAEFELLDYIISKSENELQENPKHFALMSYYANESKIADYDRLYFNSLNIQTIPYSIDKNGYNQLTAIMKKWESQLNSISDETKNKISKLTSIMQSKKLDKESIDKIFTLISDDDMVYYNFIILSCENPCLTNDLILPLFMHDYFLPNRNFKSTTSEHFRRYYLIPNLSIMDFLYAYLQYANANNDRTHFDTLRKIIDLNIEERTNSTIEDNFKIYNTIVLSIFSLDENDITDDYIDFLKYSMNTKLNRLLISKTVYEKVVPVVLKFKNIDRIKKITSVIFSIREDSYEEINSLLEWNYMQDIFEQYFLDLYRKLGSDFIDIFDKIIMQIKEEEIYYIVYKFDETPIPLVDNISYVQTLVNTYIWFATKQDNPRDFLVRKNEQLNCPFINIIKEMYDEKCNK